MAGNMMPGEMMPEGMMRMMMGMMSGGDRPMGGRPDAMMPSEATPVSPLQRIELHERMLSTRIEGLGQLKAALEPFYATLDYTQKAVADKLLMPAPMGIM